jgi:uncharacterized oligopeptide transporter (OPT) family protein
MNNETDDLKGWSYFHYAPTVVIAVCGGVLGIMFSIPVSNLNQA